MPVMDRRRVERWIAGYDKAWRTAGTGMLAELFTPDIVYSPLPWADPVVGLDAVAAYWEASRQGPDEDFSLKTEVLATEMETAVVRADVEYHSLGSSWRDLWVITFSSSVRCARFEEWPFASGKVDGKR